VFPRQVYRLQETHDAVSSGKSACLTSLRNEALCVRKAFTSSSAQKGRLVWPIWPIAARKGADCRNTANQSRAKERP